MEDLRGIEGLFEELMKEADEATQFQVKYKELGSTSEYRSAHVFIEEIKTSKFTDIFYKVNQKMTDFGFATQNFSQGLKPSFKASKPGFISTAVVCVC